MTRNTGKRGRSVYDDQAAERRRIVQALEYAVNFLPEDACPEERLFTKVVEAIKLERNAPILEAIRKAVT